MDNKNTTNSSKRNFLKTAGKFAVYAPPALMLMSNANAGEMAKSGGEYCEYERKESWGDYHHDDD